MGLIGLGLISNVHIEAYQRRKDVRIKAISDNNQARLVERGKVLGIEELYPDYRFMLQDTSLDVIDIMTPHFFHAQCVCDALLAGFTVICEKPLATTIEDIDKIIQVSRKMRKEVYVKQYLRYSLAYQKAHKLLLSNSIGRPYFVQCMFTTNSVQDYTNPRIWKGNKKEAGGGIFIDVGVHMLDLMQMMFGQPVATYAQTRKLLSPLPQKGEDFATAVIEFPNNLVVNMSCTENDTGYRFRWEVRIYGTDGVITIIDQGKEAKVLQLIKENKIRYEFVEKNWWTESNIRAIDDTIDRVQHCKEPVVSLSHARNVLYTIMQSYESAKIGKRISIK